MNKFIPMSECKDGYLYLIVAHHAHVGICRENGRVFMTNRDKFGRRYLFDEYHHDSDSVLGTVQPLREIEKAPQFETEEATLRYLSEKGKETGDEMDRAIQALIDR
jgi:hypothetical protein